MPRIPKSQSIDQTLKEAIEPVVARAAAAVAALIARMAAEEIQARIEKATRTSRTPRGGRRGAARPQRAALDRWVADRRARRVPTFVIEMVGIDTKKKIVAKYGEDAVFEKGKPAPEIRPASAKQPARTVKARPPIIRKAQAAK